MNNIFRTLLLFSLVAAAAVSIPGCAFWPRKYDLELRSAVLQPSRRYDFSEWLNANNNLPRTAIVVTISGGGTRAAALAFATLKQLSQVNMTCPPRLADRAHCTAADSVILVAAISGGSFTAAQFALSGADGLDSSFEQKVIKQNTSHLAIGGFLKPIYWGDRTAQVVDTFDSVLQFDSRPATFMDIDFRKQPFLLLQGTDILSGRAVPLVQDWFDDICSDVNRLSLSLGVAIAGSLPFALNGVHLENYRESTGCRAIDADYEPSTSTSHLAETAALARENPLEANVARYRLWLRAALPMTVTGGDGKVVAKIENPRHRTIKYLHLFDGGLSDNLGIRHMMRTIVNDGTMKSLAQKGVTNIAFIAINAHSDPIDADYLKLSGPNWIPSLIMSAAFGPVERTSEMTTFIQDENLALFFSSKSPSDSTLYPNAFVIKIDPDVLAGTGRAEVLREDFKAISLLDQINDPQIDLMREMLTQITDQSPCWNRLKDDSYSGCYVYFPGMQARATLVPEKSVQPKK